MKNIDEMRFSRTHAVLFFVLLASIYYLFWGARTDMKDTAFFGSDTWEYQSMGVNFAKGHGIQKFGSLESFKTYNFSFGQILTGF